ncbi:MAG: hypothetical protein JOY93_01370, partial [Acidobacteriales bacterium]|nr:hypothetical protein [Terriglobales bacterium]
MHPLPQTVLAYIRKLNLLQPGDRVGVAVSGGADSVGLLRLLLDVRGEIGIVLSVLHFNHQLRGSESDGDEQFVAELARAHGLDFYSDRGDAAAYAKNHLTLEAAARALRYQFFLRMMAEHRLDRI